MIPAYHTEQAAKTAQDEGDPKTETRPSPTKKTISEDPSPRGSQRRMAARTRAISAIRKCGILVCFECALTTIDMTLSSSDGSYEEAGARSVNQGDQSYSYPNGTTPRMKMAYQFLSWLAVGDTVSMPGRASDPRRGPRHSETI